MKKEGYGGRGNTEIEDAHIIDGVTGTDEKPAGSHRRRCASKFCGKWFWSRQDGDYYCCEQCDIDMHPQYATSRFSKAD